MNRAIGTYRLNWARRTSWGWWDDWDETVIQTQDSKFEPWRSEAEHATSQSRGLPTILTFTRGWGRKFFCFFQTAETGTETRTLAWKAAVLTTTLGPPPGNSDAPVQFTTLSNFFSMRRFCSNSRNSGRPRWQRSWRPAQHVNPASIKRGHPEMTTLPRIADRPTWTRN